MNKKSYSFDMETFRNMLLICPKLPGQKFVDPSFEEEILTFIRELGYPGNIKLLYDVKVDMLSQPWRTFGTIINKCLSGKVTIIDTLRLSRAQILWGLYHQEKVDYVYLLWEGLVFLIENKESRKNKYMFYPRFTKVIINYFMSQDQSILRRNKVDWHMANDDPILTTMRFIPQHEVVQRYCAILPDYLTNPAMKESEAYKIYYDLATGKVQPKPKYVRRSSRTKSDEDPSLPPVKESKHWLSDDEVNVSEHEDDDDDERTESDNDGEDFVHPNDEEVQGANTEEEEMVEEATHEEDEANELYRDVNVNLEGRDIVMTDAPLPNVQATQEIEDTHVILIAPPEGIDSIFTLNTEATSLVDVPVTTIAEPPLMSATTLPPPPTPLITHMQQTPVPTPTTVPSTSLQDLPNFGSLFGDEALAKNEAFLNSLDENIKKIIKDQVKQQVKVQVSKILPRIEKSVNEQLEAEDMTRSSTESKTSHAVAANLSELELKKILDMCTDKAKIIRKRSKPDKHGHGNGRAHKEPGECYQWSTQVNPQSTLGQSHNKTKILKLPNSPS
ncbi:hypothetical protein Tco_0892448 [Tanacetum coccineum]|uniref:Uncharacterized protein n=1 Tax=Tanacetum coccineum TaxID=301880 RepID=A0ABQ5C677_9ASTR